MEHTIDQMQQAVPTDITGLLRYQRYIIGGLNKMGVPRGDIDDRLQDVLVHCMESNFFTRVQEAVAQGKMDEKQFRAYLATTVHHLLINGRKKSSRDPAVGAISTTRTQDDAEAGTKSVDLDRLLVSDEPAETYTVPAGVLEKDLIRYIARRKPIFVPTLILWMADYRPADIARIIGKRKETIHYRMKAIFALLEEYFESAGPSEGAEDEEIALEGGGTRVYKTQGAANPFTHGVGREIYETLLAHGHPVTMKELAAVAARLMDQNQLRTSRSPEEVADSFVAIATSKDALKEQVAPVSIRGGGHAVKGVARVKYRLTSDTNPYRWGSGTLLFKIFKSRSSFTFGDVVAGAQALVDTSQVVSCRTAESIAWGFIDTARGYKVLEAVKAGQAGHTTEATVAEGPIATPLPTPVLMPAGIKENGPYRFTAACPYKRGLNYEMWGRLEALGTWTRDSVFKVGLEVAMLIASKRSGDHLAYAFFYALKKDQYTKV